MNICDYLNANGVHWPTMLTRHELEVVWKKAHMVKKEFSSSSSDDEQPWDDED